jgi:GNAT superfamily N-acetyltransferase
LAGAVQIGEIAEGDLEDLARFLARSGSGAGEVAAAPARDARHYRWFLLDNPAQPAGVPCGWLARREDGEVVGSKFCAAERFSCAGREQTLLMGGGFYVSEAHRGLGLALMRRYLEQGRRHALFASTMNAVSGALYEHYGGYPVPHTDHEWLGVLRFSPLLEEVLRRRLGSPPLARVLSRAGTLRPGALRGRARGELVRVESPAALAGLAVAPPPEHARDVTHVRDEAFLRWRYFAGPDPARALFVYRAEDGSSALVAVNLRARGTRGQVRALMVLDYWGALPASAIADVARGLAALYRERADVIVFRGQPPARQQALREAGFLRRALPRAVGVCIDRNGLLPTRSWYMVPADGDMGH